jgi:hypothetical protein
MRGLVYVTAATALAAGVARAEHLRVRIKKIDPGASTITVEVLNPEFKKYGPTKQYPLSEKVKVFQGSNLSKGHDKGLQEGTAVAGGLKAVAARLLPDSPALITVEDGAVTGIHLGPRALTARGDAKEPGGKETSGRPGPAGSGGKPSTMADLLKAPQLAEDTPGRYALAGSGATAVLVDTFTGRSWVLKVQPDGGAVWLPCRRLDSEADVQNWRRSLQAGGSKQR